MSSAGIPKKPQFIYHNISDPFFFPRNFFLYLKEGFPKKHLKDGKKKGQNPINIVINWVISCLLG